jgi:hypothetical protein
VNAQTRKLARWEAANVAAARIIAADAILYGGEDALMVRWARSVLARAGAGGNSAHSSSETAGVAEQPALVERLGPS